MKGIFFAKPIEYRLETPAEQCAQGALLKGSLSAVNRGKEVLQTPRLELALAYGDFQKIKEENPDGLVILTRQKLGEACSLKPQEAWEVSWTLELPPDCPISSKQGSPFLLYGGNVEVPRQFSRIDLQVHLSPVLEVLVSSVENHFAFAAKSRSHEDGFTEVKFKPPASYPTVEELALRMRIAKKGKMVLQFHCRNKTLNRRKGKGVGSTKREMEKQVLPSDYLLHNARPNREFFKTTIAEALEALTPGKITKAKQNPC